MDEASAEPPAADCAPARDELTEAAGSSELYGIAERLRDLEQQSAEYHRRSAHREAVIDRLHLENQRLRDEARGSVFDPITADLMRLYDGFRRDAERLAEGGAEPAIVKLLESYADDVELILDRCGVEPFFATAGEVFRVGEHTVVATLKAEHEDQNNTVAEMTSAGFRDRATGQVKRPVRAKFYRMDGAAAS
jgi:molecular chaperone GrpE